MPRFVGYLRTGSTDNPARQRIMQIGQSAGWRVEQLGQLTLAYCDRYTTFRRTEGVFCLLSGALLIDGARSAEDDADVFCRAFARDWADRNVDSVLRTCRGNFTLVFGRCEGNAEIGVSTDALSTRPLYVWQDEGGRGFAGQSTLAWRAGGFDPMKWDERGVLELLSFGYPLGERTDHPDLSVLDYATVCTVTPDRITRRAYRRWRSATTHRDTNLDHASNILESFRGAVAVRVARYGGEHCLISGGMDSRMIAVELRRQGQAPILHNFAHPQSLDFRIPQLLAKHWSAPIDSKPLDLIDFASAGGPARITSSVVHSYLGSGSKEVVPVWSGDGGSVCLGGVYLNDEIANMESAGKEKVIKYFTSKNVYKAPSRFISQRHQTLSPEVLIKDQIADLFSADITSALFHFLLANDQRRHLWETHEHCEELNIEIVTPFFDPVVLEAIDSCPIKDILAHRIYTRIFEHLPSEARVIGWQTYPGHLPSTVAASVEGEYQWSSRVLRSADIRAIRASGWEVLRSICSEIWPASLLSPWKIIIPTLLVLSGLYSRSYLVKKVDAIGKLVTKRRNAKATGCRKV